MVYIADENGNPIWDEALDPIDDGTASGSFVSGGKVVFAKAFNQTFYAQETAQTFFATPENQTFYAEEIRQTFFASPVQQTFYARPI